MAMSEPESGHKHGEQKFEQHTVDGHSQDDRLARIEQRLDAYEDRIDELEAENEQLREELHEERQARSALIDAAVNDPDEADLGEIFIAGVPAGSMLEGVIDSTGSLEEKIEDVKESVTDEMENRGQQDARLQRRITALAEKADVELTDSDVLGDDKIRRVMKHGAGDVVERVYPVHNRAADVLRNIDEWGELQTDANGRRFTLTSDQARSRLKDKRDKDLTPTEVKRVFEKIEKWGADSPRHVKAVLSGTTGDGKNRLVIGLEAKA